MASKLIDEYPLLVIPSLATVIGLNEAIILQQVHFWIENARKANDRKKHFDGHWWVYNKLEQWQKDNFPFWSLMTIRRGIKSLEDKGLLVTCQPKAYNRTKYYSIDYMKLDAICSKRTDGVVQNEQMSSVQSEQMLTETTENTTEKSAKSKILPAPKSSIFSFDGENDLPVVILGKHSKSSGNNAKEPKPKGRRGRVLKGDANNIFHDITKVYPSSIQEESILENVKDLDLWKITIKDWLMHGWKPTNVKGMLEVYLKGGPTYAKSNGNGYHHQEEHEPIAAEEY